MPKSIEIYKNNKISPELSSIIFDRSINNRFPTLQHYFKKEGLTYDRKSLIRLIREMEGNLLDTLAYAVHLYYHKMQIENNWGASGEQQVKITFCRSLLKLPSDVILTHEDAEKFLVLVEENLKKYDIANLSGRQAQEKYLNFRFTILGRSFPNYELDEIRRILSFVGSKKILIGMYAGEERTFLMGKGYSQRVGDQDVYWLQDEMVRSPNAVIAMAAISGDKIICMREESLKTIFHQKWVHFFDDSETLGILNNTDVYRNISDGIKKRVLDLYDVDSESGISKIGPRFIHDMGETILYHELGHGVMQHDMIDSHICPILEGAEFLGDNVFSALIEVVADFSPSSGETKGPMKNISEVAKTDEKRASRMFFMYLSDTWFFDTEDRYMYTYSDIMALILVQFINPDLTVNFERLDKVLKFSSPSESKGTLLGYLVMLMIDGARELETMLKNTSYFVAGKERTFDHIRRLTMENFRKKHGELDTQSYKYLSALWANLFSYADKFSDQGNKIRQHLKDEEKRIVKEIFVKAAGEKSASSFNYNQRQYIVSKMKRLGLLAYEEVV